MSIESQDAPIENPRFVFGGGGINGDLLLPGALSAIPKEVDSANTAAVTEFEKYEQAERNYRHAREENQLAPALDKAADAAAAAAGEPLPPQRAMAATSEALKPAVRRLDAARTNARNALFHLAKVIAKHRAGWLAEQDAVIAVAATEAREQLTAFTQTITDLEKERALRAALREFPPQGSLVGTRMGRINAPRTGTPSAIAELAKLIDPPAQGNTLRPSAPMSKRVLGQR